MTPEQAALLRVKFEPSEIGQLPRAGVMLDYVGHAAVTNRLLKVDPEWTWEPFALDEHGKPLVTIRGNTASMWIRLTVAGVTRIGVGTCSTQAFDVEKQLIGDAIRNAAMRFGVALDHWGKEELSGFDTGAETSTVTDAAGGVEQARAAGAPAPVSNKPQPRGPNPIVREKDNQPRPDRSRPDPTVSERPPRIRNLRDDE